MKRLVKSLAACVVATTLVADPATLHTFQGNLDLRNAPVSSESDLFRQEAVVAYLANFGSTLPGRVNRLKVSEARGAAARLQPGISNHAIVVGTVDVEKVKARIRDTIVGGRAYRVWGHAQKRDAHDVDVPIRPRTEHFTERILAAMEHLTHDERMRLVHSDVVVIPGESLFFVDEANHQLARAGAKRQAIYVGESLWLKINDQPAALAGLLAHELYHLANPAHTYEDQAVAAEKRADPSRTLRRAMQEVAAEQAILLKLTPESAAALDEVTFQRWSSLRLPVTARSVDEGKKILEVVRALSLRAKAPADLEQAIEVLHRIQLTAKDRATNRRLAKLIYQGGQDIRSARIRLSPPDGDSSNGNRPGAGLLEVVGVLAGAVTIVALALPVVWSLLGPAAGVVGVGAGVALAAVPFLVTRSLSRQSPSVQSSVAALERALWAAKFGPLEISDAIQRWRVGEAPPTEVMRALDANTDARTDRERIGFLLLVLKQMATSLDRSEQALRLRHITPEYVESLVERLKTEPPEAVTPQTPLQPLDQMTLEFGLPDGALLSNGATIHRLEVLHTFMELDKDARPSTILHSPHPLGLFLLPFGLLMQGGSLLTVGLATAATLTVAAWSRKASVSSYWRSSRSFLQAA